MIDNLKASTTSSSCIINTSFQLPCQHIFAVRHFFQLPLFDTSLINQRWSKDQLLAANISSSPSSSLKKKQLSVVSKKIKKNQTQSLSQKRKIVQTKTSKLVNIVSLSCGLEFDRK